MCQRKTYLKVFSGRILAFIFWRFVLACRNTDEWLILQIQFWEIDGLLIRYDVVSKIEYDEPKSDLLHFWALILYLLTNDEGPRVRHVRLESHLLINNGPTFHKLIVISKLIKIIRLLSCCYLILLNLQIIVDRFKDYWTILLIYNLNTVVGLLTVNLEFLFQLFGVLSCNFWKQFFLNAEWRLPLLRFPDFRTCSLLIHYWLIF